jgi:hypothetical protein
MEFFEVGIRSQIGNGVTKIGSQLKRRLLTAQFPESGNGKIQRAQKFVARQARTYAAKAVADFVLVHDAAPDGELSRIRVLPAKNSRYTYQTARAYGKHFLPAGEKTLIRRAGNEKTSGPPVRSTPLIKIFSKNV